MKNYNVNRDHSFFIKCHKLCNSYDSGVNNLFRSLSNSNARVVFYNKSKVVYEAPVNMLIKVPEVPDNSKRGIAKRLLKDQKTVTDTEKICTFKCSIFEKVKSTKQAVYVDDILFLTHFQSMNFRRGDSCEFAYSIQIQRHI